MRRRKRHVAVGRDHLMVSVPSGGYNFDDDRYDVTYVGPTGWNNYNQGRRNAVEANEREKRAVAEEEAV